MADTFDYDECATDALELLAEFGVEVTVEEEDSDTYNPVTGDLE